MVQFYSDVFAGTVKNGWQPSLLLTTTQKSTLSQTSGTRMCLDVHLSRCDILGIKILYHLIFGESDMYQWLASNYSRLIALYRALFSDQSK